jgi:pimeloyl-ACP methyl ester carboxylesterase
MISLRNSAGSPETSRRLRTQHVQKAPARRPHKAHHRRLHPGPRRHRGPAHNMIAVKDFAPGLTSRAKMKMNQPVLFMDQPESQSSADYLQSKLGAKLRLEKFEGNGHAPFVDNHERFNHVLKDLLQTSWSSHLRGTEPCFPDSEKHCSQAPSRCTSCCWLSTTRSTMGPISNLSNMS